MFRRAAHSICMPARSPRMSRPRSKPNSVGSHAYGKPRISERMILMNRGRTFIVVALALSLASSLHAQSPSHADMHHDMQHEHQSSATSPTFAELEATTQKLQQARRATETYRDVQQAEADG